MEINPGDKIYLSSNKNACYRTKNTISEYGSKGFLIQKISESSDLFGGEPAILVRSLSEISSKNMGEKEHWLGWLPVDEITLTQEREK